MPAGMPREHNRKEIIPLQSQPLDLRTMSAYKSSGYKNLMDSLKSAQNIDKVLITIHEGYHRKISGQYPAEK